VFTPVILASQKAEIRRITIQSQPKQIALKTLSHKKNPTQKKAGEMAQGVGPEFKHQHNKKKKKKKEKKNDTPYTGIRIYRTHNLRFNILQIQDIF
jgi:hypothetical protein